MLRIALALCIMLLTSACSGLPKLEPATAWRSWSAAKGGVLRPEQSPGVCGRAQGALAQVADPAEHGWIRIRVLANDSIGAWAWRDGTIFVTRGLVDLMDDAELAAAIAHELGHVARLEGEARPRASERTADAIGLEFLHERGLEVDAMVSMLTKLESNASAVYSKGIGERIDLVRVKLEALHRQARAQTSIEVEHPLSADEGLDLVESLASL